jgi:antitoxin (DNA-binding transcriptional repressor) of toxin-antitoxin stability system
MLMVDMLAAKSRLSQRVELLQSGAEAEIVTAHNGRPVARLVTIVATANPKRRLGLLAGQYRASSQAEFDRRRHSSLAFLRATHRRRRAESLTSRRDAPRP